MAKKLYELLEIDETATAEDIRKAYKKQALKHHPDKNKDDPQAQERFKDISNAYAILSDEVLRPLYDKGQIDDTGNPVAEEVNATFFSEDPEERAKQFEEILKQFHKATEEAKKAAQKVFEEEIKPHLNDKQVKNPPGSKTYYIYIPGFNPNTKKDYAKDFFDVENDELRSKIAEELHNKDGILVFESREEALSAGRLVRDKFWGNDSDDVVIECFLSPELLEKTTSFFKSGGSEIDMEELNDHGKRNCFSFKQSPIGSNLFSLGNISAVYIVNALVNLCAHPGDPEAKKILDVRLEKEVIHNSNFHNPKIKAIIQALDKGETKLKKQEILLREIKKNQLSVAEFSLLYNAVKNIEPLNEHRNPNLDRFFGIKNTTSWRNTLQEFRARALSTLLEEVEAIDDPNEKFQRLESAKQLPLFKEHRNNSVFTGAWGRTSAVKKIEEQQEEILKSMPSMVSR